MDWIGGEGEGEEVVLKMVFSNRIDECFIYGWGVLR